MKEEFSKKVLIKIIDLYREYPILWNTSDPYYRNASKKFDAWQRIADVVDTDITTLRKKINSLFASYRRERRRVREGYRSKWFLYDRLSFLPNHVLTMERHSHNDDDVELMENIEEEHLDEDAEDFEGSIQEEDSHYFESPTEEVYVSEYSHPSSTTTKNQTVIYVTENEPKPKLKKRENTYVVTSGKKRKEESMSDMGKINSVRSLAKPDSKDEFDAFGDYVAKSLRKHDPRTQAVIKHAINNIIYEQEIKKYESTTTTVVFESDLHSDNNSTTE